MANSLPFERGKTFYGQTETIDTNNLKAAHLEGKTYTIEDFDYSSSAQAKPLRSGHMVTLKVVRNASGFAGALLPKRLVKFAVTSALTSGSLGGVDMLGRVDGYACLTADGPVGVVDEWLPAAGARYGDLFFVVVDGPTQVLTDIAATATNLINLGTTWLVSLTAATSGATTSGRVGAQDLTGATALQGDQIQHRLGRALSANTTGQTNRSLLVYLTKW